MRVFAVCLGILAFSSSPSHAQWVPAGLQGGPVKMFALIDTEVFAADSGGGVFRSLDSGYSWTQMNSGLASLDVVAIGHLGNNLFAATASGGPFGSTDRLHWTRLDGWASHHPITSIVSIDSALFASTNGDGVYRSIDSGLSWSQVNNGLTSVQVTQLITVQNNLFALTLDAGVWRSSDFGDHWISSSQGLANGGVVTLYSSDSEIIGAGSQGLYISVNYGRAWINRNPVDTFRYGVYSVARGDSGIFVGTGKGLYRTTDEGLHWQQTMNVYSDVIQSRMFAVFPLHSIVLAASEFALSRSTDHGMSWPQTYYDPRPFGPGLAQPVNSIYSWGSFLYAGSVSSGVLRSSDNGQDWSSGRGMSINTVNCFASMGTLLFVGTDTGGVYRSTDSGSSWTALEGISNSYPVTSLLVTDSLLYAATDGGGIFLTSDRGFTWLSASSGLSSLKVHSLLMNDSVLLAGIQGGVVRSLDFGKSWMPSDSILQYDTIFLAKNNNEIFAGTTDGGVFRSRDNGKSWSTIITAIDSRGTFDAFIATDSLIIAGSEGYGAYSIGIAGSRWIRANEGLPSFEPILGLAIINDFVYAGSETIPVVGLEGLSQGGIWRRPLSDFPKPPTPKQAVASTAESGLQLYPNPTKGPLEIEGAQCVTITNVLGIPVFSAKCESMLDLSTLPAGTYFARVVTADGIMVRKILKQ